MPRDGGCGEGLLRGCFGGEEEEEGVKKKKKKKKLSFLSLSLSLYLSSFFLSSFSFLIL